MVCPFEVKGDSVLVGATLVVLFQSFSFCIYYVGASQTQRSLSHILHTALLNFVIGSLLWFTVGHSMVFGKSQKGFIGSMNNALLLDLQESRFNGNETVCNTMKSYPEVVLVSFEMAFAIMAPVMVLITWVEDIKPAGALLFVTIWPLLVYYPVAHWIRGGGWLSTTFNVLDFAGGLTLQTTAGSSHLLLTILMKKASPSCEKISIVDQYLQKTTENSHIVMLAIGSLFTAVGWYCFNVGSLRSVDNFYSLVLLNTHFTACGSVVFWLLLSITNGHWSLTDILNGLMVGLAGASSFSAYVETWSALLIGCIIGFISHGLLIITKKHTNSFCTRKNAIDTTFIFGVPGILGSIAAGLFSRTSIDSEVESGAFYSNGIQLPYQLLGIVVAIVWPLVWTALLLKFIHSTVGLFLTQNPSCVNLSQSEIFSVSEIHERNNVEVELKEKLMKAARNGNLKEIQELRETSGVDLGLKCFNERTALYYACEGGHTDCVEYLLEQREVNIHAKDRYGATPLSEAVRKHRDKLVTLLLEHGAKSMLDGVGEILCSYVSEGKIDEVRRLKMLGMDLNARDSHGRTALHVAASRGDKLMTECLINMNVHLNKVDLFGNRPLNCSEMHEHEEVSEILIRHGALRISQNYSQREIAEEASKGNLRMMRHMVHNGASVCFCDGNGRTALHISSETGHLDLVKFLLNQSGVNINAKDKKNNTPLTEEFPVSSAHWKDQRFDAIVNTHNDVAEFLQINGGDVDERRMMHLICKATRKCDKHLLKQLLTWFNGSTVVDYDGQSVYHICVSVGDAETLRTLVKAGIYFKEVNFLGYTPLELAIQLKSNSSIIKILSQLEEGKITSHCSQHSVENKKPAPNPKSKIRRRRTRRQTRVEVVTNHFTEEETIPTENASRGTERFLNHPRPSKTPNGQQNGTVKDLTVGRVNRTRTDTQVEVEEEVTLADIELMNRKKQYQNHEPRFTQMVGEPHYV